MFSRRGFLMQAAALAAADPAEFQVRPTALFNRKLQRVLAATIRDPNWCAGTVEYRTPAGAATIELRTAVAAGDRVLLPVDMPEAGGVCDCTYRNGAKVWHTRCHVQPERRWTVWLVHHSHQDMGFDNLPSKLRANYVAYLDEAVALCRKNISFKWNIEVSYLVEDYRKARGEEKFRELMDLVRSGAMEIGAFYDSSQTECLTLEPLHRLVHYAAVHLAREFNLKVRSAILTDVPGFAWGLADVMANSGVRYFLWGPNSERSNVALEWLPPLFWWQGPAGGRVLVWQSQRYSEAYHMFFHPRLKTKFDISEPDVVADAMLERYRRGQYPHDAILVQAAGDFIRPTAGLCGLVERWNSQWAYPNFRLATVSEFFEHMEGRSGIPVLRGGCPDAWNDQRISMAAHEATARRIENELPDAEKWAAVAALTGAGTADFESAYHHLLHYEEHTLGWRGGRQDPYVDEAQGGGKRHYEEKIAWVESAARETAVARQRALGALGRSIRAGKRPRIAVWNALSWTRTGLVRMPARPGGFVLRDAATGAVVPCQMAGGEVAFLAADVPALGYRVYEIEEGSTPSGRQAAQRECESPFYRVRLNASGCITSLIETRTGQELVDDAGAHLMHELVYVTSRMRSSRRLENTAEYRGRSTLAAGQEGPVFTSLRATGSIESFLRYEQEVVLYHGIPRVDLITRMRKQRVYLKEGLYLAFPFAVALPQRFGQTLPNWPVEKTEMPLRISVPGGFMRPENEQLPESSRDYYIAEHGVHLADATKSIFWANIDAPVFQIGGIQSNRWLTHLTNELEGGKVHLYSYLMNNHWTVNAPIVQGGEFQFRYAITSSLGLAEGKQFGWDALAPMTATELQPAGGDWPETGSFLRIDPPNVALVAWKQAADGDGFVLRLAETAGLDCQAQLTPAIPGRRVRKVLLCDAREAVRSEAALELDMAPFEVVTVRLIFD
jgi:alpha-mannosidase